jgi:protocatechuate 3,4-dioxygenase, alpha subunit
MSLPTTPSQTVGPYYSIGLCRRRDNELAPDGMRLCGQLLDGAGEPVDGMIELWDAVGRRWGRCGTDADGGFEFTLPDDADVFEVYVFARGLLEHQRTRLYVPEATDDVLESLPEDERTTLVATRERGEYRFDIRLQGDRETVFFAV